MRAGVGAAGPLLGLAAACAPPFQDLQTADLFELKRHLLSLGSNAWVLHVESTALTRVSPRLKPG